MLGLDVADLAAPPHAPEGWTCGTPFLFVPLRNRAAIARAHVRPDVWDRVVGRWWTPAVFIFAADPEHAEAGDLQLENQQRQPEQNQQQPRDIDRDDLKGEERQQQTQAAGDTRLA